MRWMVAGVALLVAGCSGEKVDQSINLVFDTNLQKSTVTMTCRESTSGTCHALFASKDDVVRLDAAVGATATATGITDASRYCVGVDAPADRCDLKPLAEGQQIIRARATHS